MSLLAYHYLIKISEYASYIPGFGNQGNYYKPQLTVMSTSQ